VENPSYYAVIPASVRYAKIPPNAKLLYGEITALSQKEGYCYASNKYFAEIYEVENTTISEWLKRLHECGFIKVFVDKAAGNQRKIWIVDPLREKPNTSSGKSEDPSSGKAEDNNTRFNKKPPTPKGGSERFEEFWNAWGSHHRKTDKDKCKAKWVKNGLDGKIDEVLAALAAWKASPDWLKEEGQFIPAPLVWLNNRRWETPPPPPKKKVSDPFAPNYNPLGNVSW
jgi:hypothetical protein